MSLNESLHLKVQNKRPRGYPGDIDLSYWKSPQADGNNLFRFRGKRLGEALMKALPKRKGTTVALREIIAEHLASMKVHPKRKGNSLHSTIQLLLTGLNESPSEKKGKYR